MMDHLVIMGGGLVGSLAAGACASYARRITLIESSVPLEHGQKGGAPQSDHVHIFLKRGQIKMEKLIPGILSELEAFGAVKADWAWDTEWSGPYGVFAPFHSGVETLLFSRRLLNSLLWKRLRLLSHVTVITSSVQRVVIEHKKIKEIHLKNGLIIDDADHYVEARGRYSAIKESLEGHLGPVPEKRIDNRIRYVSSVLETSNSQTKSIKQYYRKPDGKHISLGYYVSPIEGGRMLFTAVDYHGRFTDPFRELASHPALKGSTMGPLKSFGQLHNVHRQYGQLPTWISNLSVLGDAVAQLNPVFGLGMTLATEHVELFADELRRPQGVRAQRLQKKIDGLIRPRWFAVALNERGEADKPSSFFYQWADRYAQSLSLATYSSQRMHRLALQVLHGVRSPLVFLLPWNIVRIISSEVLWRIFSTPKKGSPKRVSYEYSIDQRS